MPGIYCDCKNHELPVVVQKHRENPLFQYDNTEWLIWPTNINELWDQIEIRNIRHYMSCKSVLSNLATETRAKALSGLKVLQGCGSYVLMQGGQEEQWNYYQSDVLMDVFKQEQFFRYIFGVDLPDCYGIIDIDTSKTYLFVPELSENAIQFMGELESDDQIKNTWGLDGVLKLGDLASFISSLQEKSPKAKCYILEGVNSDSGLTTRNTANIETLGLEIDKYDIDRVKLYEIIEECRVTKTPKEFEMLRMAAYVSSMAHCLVMKNSRGGLEELYHEALFKSACAIIGGARNVAYTCICASHVNASILHYGHTGRPNDRVLTGTELLLHDMGGIFPAGYVADITVTYPTAKKFDDKQLLIYQTVLNANLAVQNAAKAGVNWIDMHKLSEFEIIKGLQKCGIVDKKLGENKLLELVEKRLIGYFMPHGLGHLIGLDVHDCGAHNHERKSELNDKRGLRSLRCTRDLIEGMYITVEPGCYFIPYLIAKLKQDDEFKPYINFDILDSYVDVGGVRIEDDVVVTSTGTVNFAVVPREVCEIESYLKLTHEKAPVPQHHQ